MQLITNWLNGKRNFDVGVIIYNTVGKDDAFKALLAKGKTPHSEKRLLEELTALATVPVITPAVVETLSVEIMPDSTDNVLMALKNEWLPLYQSMNYKRHQLDRYQNNSAKAIAERKLLAFEVIELEQQCMAIWAKRDYYLENGKLPDVATSNEFVVPVEPLALAKAISNCERNIRRNKDNMKKFPAKATFADLYNKYTAYYTQLTGKQYKHRTNE